MPRHPGLRAAVLATATLVVGGVLAGLPVGSAVGATGDPQIISPAGTQPLYEGFTGPYVVSFDSAPAGNYTYRVQHTPTGQAVVVDDEGALTSDGAGRESVSLAALAPGAAYTFVVEDEATGDHRSEVTFEVRAGAQPRCSLVVPGTLRVNAAEETVSGRLSSNCAAAEVQRATWDVKDVARGTNVNLFQFIGATTDSWRFNDSSPLGVYAAKPAEAANADGDDIAQNAPRTEIRLDARLSFSGSRDGSSVTLRTSARKYSRYTNGFVPWGEHTLALSYRTCGTCPWTYLRSVTTGASGSVSYRFRATVVRTYRVTSGGTSTHWAPYPLHERL